MVTHVDFQPRASSPDFEAPPHDLAAEESVLGTALLVGHLPDVCQSLSPDDFFDAFHRIVFAAVQQLAATGASTDPISVADLLQQTGKFEALDRPVRLAELPSAAVVGAVADHAGIIARHSRERARLTAAATVQAARGNEETWREEVERVDRLAPPVSGLAGLLEGDGLDPLATDAEPLPTVPGFPFVHPGGSAIIVGESGGGRSNLAEVGLIDAALDGVRGVYLGSEVTFDEFNARSRLIAEARGIALTDDDNLRRLANVRYVSLYSTIVAGWADPVGWAREMARQYAIAVLDPLSAVAAALDLDFDKSNSEYVAFYDRLVQPLIDADLAVLLIDNIGHAADAQRRAKGVSAKRDKADLKFSTKRISNPAGLRITAEKVRSTRAPFQRLDSWDFDRDSLRITYRPRGDANEETTSEPWRPTILMERISRAVEATPGLTKRGIRATKGKNDQLDIALDRLVAEGYVVEKHENRAVKHYSERPYRAENDERAPRAPSVPPSVPRHGPDERAPVPPTPTGGHGHGTETKGTETPTSVPPTGKDHAKALHLVEDNKTEAKK